MLQPEPLVYLVNQAVEGHLCRKVLERGVALGANALGYVGVNAYANDRDASKVNAYGAFFLGGLGGAAAVYENRVRQGHRLITRPGSVNNHLFPGGAYQEM